LLDGESFYDRCARRKLLTLLVEETGRLERIVTNLLAMSRIDARAWRAERELVDVGDIVAAVVRRVAASPRSPRIDVDVDADLPAVLADPMQLDLVVSNLIDNARRHGPSGRPVRVATDQEGGCVRISVVDEGAGIDPTVRDHVFEPFVTRTGGKSTGIGLALCKAIVTVHGGTIDLIVNGDTKGTAAVVRLPPA
jgi:two-component system, OmpR family, sensor histidine kinase KdpD